MGTDKDWEKWGATDPYFGVVSSEKYRRGALDERALHEFFESGERHVARVLSLIQANCPGDFTSRRVLDFGCGVGRLLLPLAAHAQEAVGVDVSTSMLAEASRNAKAMGVDNIKLVLADQNLTGVEGCFDLIHSYIVFQHIPWRRGRVILQRLAEHVVPGGVLAVHFFTSCTVSPVVRGLVKLRYVLPPANWARNLLKGRPMFEPAMQLHCYDDKAVARDLVARGFEPPQFLTEPGMAAFNAVFLLARRAACTM